MDHTFLESPTDQTVIAGISATLPCSPPLSDPPPSILWFYNDAPLIHREGAFALTTLDDGSLYFANVQLPDHGVYVCTAVNRHAIPQSVASEPVTLTVHGK